MTISDIPALNATLNGIATVLILTGFLAGRYALDSAMSLYASLVFEQSYGGVDGDSVYLAALPVAHNFPMSSPGIFGALYAGARVVMALAEDQF